MKRNLLPMLPALCLLGMAMCCAAQAPVAPTPESVGPVRGDDWSGYNVVNSFETGDRFVSTSGSDAKYESDENLRNGIRLFSSFFSVDAKNGHGPLFDQLQMSTSDLGADPYSTATLRASKNRLYEYNLIWRKSDYLNPGLTTDGGAEQHLLDTTYTLQDHDLTLFPQSDLRFSLGYSRDTQSGAGISTVQLFQTSGAFDNSGDVLPLFTNIKRVTNEFRLGAEGHWHGLVLNVLHGWEDYKDDTPYSVTAPETVGNTTLNSLRRTEPDHGTSPYWRVALFRNSRWLEINSRFTYTGGARAFFANETATGASFGSLANQQILSFGDARRPVATGNLNLTLLPTPKLTVASRTSVYNVRTEGDSTFLQYDNATQNSDFLYFQFLGIRTVETDEDVRYQVANWLDVHGGYDYSDRRISASPQFAFAGSTSATNYTQTEILQGGTLGFRATPVKGLTLSGEDELGRSNQPFTPKGDRDYNSYSARIEYKWKMVRLRAWSSANYNANSTSLSSYSSRSRSNSVSGSWSPRSWVGIDASYSKLHVDTLGGIAFFANALFYPSEVSYYVSNLYAGTLTARLGIRRADIYVGFSRIQDVGDGRSDPSATTIGPPFAAFQTAQTFPLAFTSPSARVSIKIRERLRWNIGYQYFGYEETFSKGEDYHANTGYTSLLWSF